MQKLPKPANIPNYNFDQNDYSGNCITRAFLFFSETVKLIASLVGELFSSIIPSCFSSKSEDIKNKKVSVHPSGYGTIPHHLSPSSQKKSEKPIQQPNLTFIKFELELLAALEQGNKKELKQLLQLPADFSERKSKKESILRVVDQNPQYKKEVLYQVCVNNYSPLFIKKLLELEGSIDFSSPKSGNTVWHEVCQQGNGPLIKVILEEILKNEQIDLLDAKNGEDKTGLQLLIEKRDEWEQRGNKNAVYLDHLLYKIAQKLAEHPNVDSHLELINNQHVEKDFEVPSPAPEVKHDRLKIGLLGSFIGIKPEDPGSDPSWSLPMMRKYIRDFFDEAEARWENSYLIKVLVDRFEYCENYYNAMVDQGDKNSLLSNITTNRKEECALALANRILDDVESIQDPIGAIVSLGWPAHAIFGEVIKLGEDEYELKISNGGRTNDHGIKSLKEKDHQQIVKVFHGSREEVANALAKLLILRTYGEIGKSERPPMRDYCDEFYGCLNSLREIVDLSIPPRKSQEIGNCGLHNPKQLIFYDLQQLGQVRLANLFKRYIQGTLAQQAEASFSVIGDLQSIRHREKEIKPILDCPKMELIIGKTTVRIPFPKEGESVCLCKEMVFPVKMRILNSTFFELRYQEGKFYICSNYFLSVDEKDKTTLPPNVFDNSPFKDKEFIELKGGEQLKLNLFYTTVSARVNRLINIQ